MFTRFLFWLARRQKGDIHVGIRPYIMETAIYFLNSPLALLKPLDFGGLGQLRKLAQRAGRRISLYTWSRDEYGTSDGAGFVPMNMFIRPEDSDEQLQVLAAQADRRLSKWLLVPFDPNEETLTFPTVEV